MLAVTGVKVAKKRHSESKHWNSWRQEVCHITKRDSARVNMSLQQVKRQRRTPDDLQKRGLIVPSPPPGGTIVA